MKCPKCKSLVTARELHEATYDKSQQMVITAGKNGEDMFVPAGIAERDDIGGPVVWVRREVNKAVCDACCDELKRGRYAHGSTKVSGAWSRKR